MRVLNPQRARPGALVNLHDGLEKPAFFKDVVDGP